MIAETIRIGINTTHRDSRVAQMLAFGRDKIMPRSDVENVATYVQTLSNPAAAAQFETSKLEAGKNAFMTNCSACHGDNGKGNVELGAPDLTDNVWVYGGDPQSIFDSIWNGRQGHMPAWEGRLGPIERKILAVYLSDLRSRKP